MATQTKRLKLEQNERKQLILDLISKFQGQKVRGEATSWIEIFRFENSKAFKDSDIAKRLEKEFLCRKNREFDYADIAEYECKFRRRVGFIPSPWKIKVLSKVIEPTLQFIYFQDLTSMWLNNSSSPITFQTHFL